MARVPYKTQEDIDDEFKEYLVSMVNSDERLNVYSAIGNNPEVLKGFRHLLQVIWNHTGLTNRQREIVILTSASEVKSRYEWQRHVPVATRCGLKHEEILAIASDNRSIFSSEEEALIAYTRAITRDRVIDGIHDEMEEYFNEKTIVGTAAAGSIYFTVGLIIAALGIEIESRDKFIGWDLSNYPDESIEDKVK